MASLAMGTPAAPSFGEKLWRINWGLILVLTAIAAVGTVALYSAAGGRFDPWAARHAIRYGAALAILLATALMPPKVWLCCETWAWRMTMCASIPMAAPSRSATRWAPVVPAWCSRR